MRKDKVFHLISNTHWDREWRFPFQRNRQMLVDMIDEVLRVLEKYPEYRAFHLDSQSVVIQDYLEVRPQNRERIQKLVNEQRLFIGPWFILPDEFLVGGENLIRNLLLGHKICRDIGRVSKIGYSPFSWGQISQLPQLYKEFGISLIMFYRGVNSLDSHNAEFIWVGADGTEAVSSRFSTMPRYNFYFYIYRTVVHNEDPFLIEHKWSKGGNPFHFADEAHLHEDYFMLKPHEGYTKENVYPWVKKLVDLQADDFTTRHAIWMEGHDSSGINERTLEILKDIKEQIPELNFLHSTLEDYARLILEEADRDKLPKVHGERRSAQFDRRSGNLYGYVTSARMFIKQKNFEAERALQFYAEPMYTLMGLLGGDNNTRYLDIAWNYLIQNSAHDSIGGCSLDGVHDDMMSRYKQVIEISTGVYERALKHILANVNHSLFIKEEHYPDIFLNVVNTLPSVRSNYISAVVDIPVEYASEDFELADANGNRYDKIVYSREQKDLVLEQLINRPMYFSMHRYHCLIEANNIPSFGWKSLRVIPLAKKLAAPVTKRERNVLENNYLKVTVNGNGTFDVKNKSNGKTLKGLGYFYDEGDSGHAWVLTPEKPVFTTLDARPKVTKTVENALETAVLINYTLKIPSTRRNDKGKPKIVSLPVSVTLTLRKNDKHLGVVISLDNTAEDHRLRFMFPTKIKAEHHYAEGQFDVVKRPVKRIDSKGWIEQPMYDFPMHHFMDLSDGENGLALITEGLKEYEVTEKPVGTIALTLFRAFTYIISPSAREDYSHEKGSQCPGKHTYKLALYPHKGLWSDADVYNVALQHNTPLSLVQTGRSEGTLPTDYSFLKISNPKLVFSCLKPSEDGRGYILRVYNPTETEETAEISINANLKSVQKCTLEELPEFPLNLMGNQFTLKAAPKKIVTVLFEIKK